MAGQRKSRAPSKKRRGSTGGRIIRTVATSAAGYGAYKLGMHLFGKRASIGKGARKVTAAVAKAVKPKRVAKNGKWQKALGKQVPIGKSGRRSSVYGVSAVASTVKRRRSNTWGRKTTIKAGPGVRSAFKKVIRKGVPKTRVTALARRR